MPHNVCICKTKKRWKRGGRGRRMRRKKNRQATSDKECNKEGERRKAKVTTGEEEGRKERTHAIPSNQDRPIFLMKSIKKRRKGNPLLVPLEVLGITKLTRGDLMLDAKDNTKDKANSTNDDVGITEEGVSSSDPGGGRQHHVFLS